MKYCNPIYSNNEILQFRTNGPEVKTGMRGVVSWKDMAVSFLWTSSTKYFAQTRLITTEKLKK